MSSPVKSRPPKPQHASFPVNGHSSVSGKVPALGQPVLTAQVASQPSPPHQPTPHQSAMSSLHPQRFDVDHCDDRSQNLEEVDVAERQSLRSTLPRAEFAARHGIFASETPLGNRQHPSGRSRAATGSPAPGGVSLSDHSAMPSMVSRPPRRPSANIYATPTILSPALSSLAARLTSRPTARDAFVPDVDRPYFAHCEFLTVLQTDMAAILAKDATLGGDASVETRTRQQWARVRKRMCTVFPAGCAAPRRMSKSFLTDERAALDMYRRDARAVLRKVPLADATDLHSGAPLGRLWWQRYPFELPSPPSRGSLVFVPQDYLPKMGCRNNGEKENRGATGKTSGEAHMQLDSSLPGLHSAQVASKRPRKRPRSTISRYQGPCKEASDGLAPVSPSPTESRNEGGAGPYRLGKFLSLAPNGKVTVHVDNDVVTVPDVDVMLAEPEYKKHSVRGLSVNGSEGKLASSMDNLPEPVVAHLKATAAAVAAVAAAKAGNTAFPEASAAHRAFAASAAASPAALLLPPQTPQSLTPSPRKMVKLKKRSGSNVVEYEVHVRAVTEAMRLLDRKANLLETLQSANNSAEGHFSKRPEKRAKMTPILTADVSNGGSAGAGAVDNLPKELREMHSATLEALALVNARIDVVLPGLRGPGGLPGLDTGTGDVRSSFIVPGASGDPDFYFSPSHVGGPGFPGYKKVSRRSRLPLADQLQLLQKQRSSSPAPAMFGSTGPVISRIAGGKNPSSGLNVPSKPIAYEPSGGGEDGAVGFGAVPGMASGPAARRPSPAGLRPEHLAKNVDFRTSGGAAQLGKALARQALGQLAEDDKLKAAPAALRADVIECVSACVALLMRARVTRSSDSVEDLVEALRVKCPENEYLISSVKSAVREFDSTSSESR